MRVPVGALLAALFVAVPARAEDAQKCAAAYERGQELRLAHELSEARDQFLVCARPGCPKVARDDCARWLGEVDAVLPGIVVHATRAGTAFSDARVVVDGSAVAEEIEGHTIALDPGRHTVRVEPRGCAPHEAVVVLSQGAAPASVDFDVCSEVPASRAPSVHPRAALPLAPVVFGGLALAGLGAFIGFGAVGLADSNELRSTCYPHCPQGSVDAANAELLVADVALGVTIVSLSLGAVFWIMNRAHHAPSASVGMPLTWSF